MTAAEYGTIFDVEVQFGNQSFLLLFDTGSSDTWVVEKGFRCLDPDTYDKIPEASCTYGKPYVISDTFQDIRNETFAVQYGTGQASGLLGYEDIIVGGIHVPRQKVGVVSRATNVGDGIDSGLIGFGHDILTSAHPASFDGSNFNQSFLADRITYESAFTSMWKQGKVDPFFSLAIEHTPLNTSIDKHGGFLALGALPPVKHTNKFANVSVEITEGIPASYTGGKHVITEWTLSVQEVTYGRESNSTRFQAVVDSGNYFNLYPPEIAAEINNRFDPPAVLSSEDGAGEGVYTVLCDAKAPAHGVKIGNQTFYHDSRDMILQTGEGCVSSIVAAIPVDGISLYFLGDPFLKNVVAVFDFEHEEMRFAART